MEYTPEVQAMIDAEAGAQKKAGPSFPMPRVRHNGKTGEWSVREVDEAGKLAEATTPFEVERSKDGKETKWKGVVVRVAWMVQSKYKENSPSQKKSREFTDFKTEPIEVLKYTFGASGIPAKHLKTYANYQDLKAQTALKDDEGNPVSASYDLKAILYVYHFGRKQVLKLEVGGASRGEWFTYQSFKPVPAGGESLSDSWAVTLEGEGIRLLKQIVTEFRTTPHINEAGLASDRLYFRTGNVLTSEELHEVMKVSDKLKMWVDGWKAVNAPKPAQNRGEGADAPMPVTVGLAATQGGPDEEQIDLDSIPF